jgi:UDP-N-acetylmuramoyl-tripeptide--D-alanyl-D-alanine ligase
MFELTVSNFARLVNGQVSTGCNPDALILGATIDSRQVTAGVLFFALPGTQNHGAHFCGDAVRQGAVAVVVDASAPEIPESGAPLIRVPDTAVALQTLGHWNRQQSDALVIGITGSVGKTTTRQMIAAVLGAVHSGIQSPANYNNELGVPLTLLQLTREHAFAVVEIGASGAGEITQLAELARPEFAVVTRVAPAHLEGFGSLAGVQRAKQELAASIPPEGTVFLNGDDPLVKQMADVVKGSVILFGEGRDCDVRAEQVEWRNGMLSFWSAGSLFQVNAPGRHLICSALAAVAAGRQAGLRNADIQNGLASFAADSGRGRIIRSNSRTIIDDSYNASPASVAAAIENLSAWTGVDRRILVLGDMLELGSECEQLHKEVGRQIGRSTIDHVLMFGKQAEVTASGVLETSIGLRGPWRVSVFHDLDLLLTMLECLLGTNDVILVKGSRGMRMERVVTWLQQQRHSF